MEKWLKSILKQEKNGFKKAEKRTKNKEKNMPKRKRRIDKKQPEEAKKSHYMKTRGFRIFENAAFSNIYAKNSQKMRVHKVKNRQKRLKKQPKIGNSSKNESSTSIGLSFKSSLKDEQGKNEAQ